MGGGRGGGEVRERVRFRLTVSPTFPLPTPLSFHFCTIPSLPLPPPPSHRKTVVVGSGYIAVELAGILNALGSDVSIVVRYNKARSHCSSPRERNQTLCFVVLQ